MSIDVKSSFDLCSEYVFELFGSFFRLVFRSVLRSGTVRSTVELRLVDVRSTSGWRLLDVWCIFGLRSGLRSVLRSGLRSF